MITPELFNQNETLRLRLAGSMDILQLAMTASLFAEDERMATLKGDAITYAMSHEGRVAINRFIHRIFKMAQVNQETIGPLEASYHGVDDFDKVRLDAEREYAEKHPKPVLKSFDEKTEKTTKTRKAKT